MTAVPSSATHAQHALGVSGERTAGQSSTRYGQHIYVRLRLYGRFVS